MTARIRLSDDDEVIVQNDHGECFRLRSERGHLFLIKDGGPGYSDRVVWSTRENATCSSRNYISGCTLPEAHKGSHKDCRGYEWDR